MHFLLKLAYEMHIKVLVNNEFMLPFHMCCRSLELQQIHHLVFQEVNLNHNWILKKVKSCFLFYVIFVDRICIYSATHLTVATKQTFTFNNYV